MIKVLCIQSVSFSYQLYKFLYPPILEWNADTETFFNRGKTAKRYWLWIFTFLVPCFGIGAPSMVFTILKASHFKLMNVLFSLILLPVNLSISASAAIIFWHVEDIVEAFDRMKQLLQQIGKIEYPV